MFDAAYRNGEWVKFEDSGTFAGAHHAPDGKVVGIYQRAEARPTGNPSHPFEVVPSHINVVAPDGNNHVVLRAGTAVDVRCSPDAVLGLGPANPVVDAPRCRVEHLMTT